jgi:hypothetical protein
MIFREHDITDAVHVFFVELFEHSQRRMCCDGCGEDYDVEEFFASRGARSTRLPMSTQGTLPCASSRKIARGSGKDDDVEEELAALKRRLARKGGS